VLTVDRLRFGRPSFDVTLSVFDLTLRTARAGVLFPPFARVPRFPLVFFLPELRFVCRVILPSSRMRALTMSAACSSPLMVFHSRRSATYVPEIRGSFPDGREVNPIDRQPRFLVASVPA
jgi:hypothetical protein